MIGARLEDVSPGASWSSRCGGWRRRAWRPAGKVIERGYEGYVAKNEASVYEGGPTNGSSRVKVPGATEADDRCRRVKTPASYGAVAVSFFRPMRPTNNQEGVGV